MGRFDHIGIIKNEPTYDMKRLNHFLQEIARVKSSDVWSRDELVSLFLETIPEFDHKETGKFLDNRM